MQLLREAGPFGPLLVLLFIAGLAVVVRARSAIASVPFVLAILAVGQLASGMGQHAVREGVALLPDVAQQVRILNAGTGEAASALVISGMCALLLALVASGRFFAERNNE